MGNEPQLPRLLAHHRASVGPNEHAPSASSDAGPGQGARSQTGTFAPAKTALALWRRLCRQLMRTASVSHGNTLLAPVAGLIMCAPKFLGGSITLGELAQAAAAFTLVQGSFN
jgi:hypothetical protein